VAPRQPSFLPFLKPRFALVSRPRRQSHSRYHYRYRYRYCYCYRQTQHKLIQKYCTVHTIIQPLRKPPTHQPTNPPPPLAVVPDLLTYLLTYFFFHSVIGNQKSWSVVIPISRNYQPGLFESSKLERAFYISIQYQLQAKKVCPLSQPAEPTRTQSSYHEEIA